MQFKFNNYNFKQLYLNTIFNSEGVVLENFYEAMVYVAFKFEALVMTRFECSRNIDSSVVLKELQQIVYYYSFKSFVLLSKAKGITKTAVCVALLSILYRTVQQQSN